MESTAAPKVGARSWVCEKNYRRPMSLSGRGLWAGLPVRVLVVSEVARRTLLTVQSSNQR
jgi:hypothetical protein